MAEEKEERNNATSIRLFFIVLGGIVAYQFSGLLRGEPEWVTFADEPGAFVVDVTGTPDQLKLSEKFPFGEIEFQFFTFARNDVQYAIAYADLPDVAGADSALVAVGRALANKVKGEIIEERADSLGGMEARRVRIKASDDSILLQLSAYRDGRLYRLMAGAEEEELQKNADLQHFFSSFRLAVHGVKRE